VLAGCWRGTLSCGQPDPGGQQYMIVGHLISMLSARRSSALIRLAIREACPISSGFKPPLASCTLPAIRSLAAEAVGPAAAASRGSASGPSATAVAAAAVGSGWRSGMQPNDLARARQVALPIAALAGIVGSVAGMGPDSMIVITSWGLSEGERYKQAQVCCYIAPSGSDALHGSLHTGV
jgi:hypothetical protein